MKLTFIGAAHEVTGSCHYLEAGGRHILIDCGMEQGVQNYEKEELPIEEAMVDYVLLTHAHVDHSGMLPALYAKGFRGQILATEATADLCSIMLRDCAHIQMQETEWKNRKAKRHSGVEPYEPLYTMEDADGVIKRIVPCKYNHIMELCEGIKIRFTDVGHLLGSASIEVWVLEDGQEKKIVFSGDIGNIDQPLIKDPAYTEEADYVVMESTYGNRVHSAGRPDYVADLAKVLQETFDRGGNVVIPSFAVGRTQEMLFFMRKIKTENLLPEFPDFEVYIDSPLAVEATNIFHKNVKECFRDRALELIKKGVNPIGFPGLKVAVSSDESKMINFINKPIVIISASGMCEAGRIRHHLKHNLWRSDSTVLFVGYQVPGTLGNHLLGGAKEVKLFGETIEVKAKIENLAGISGHADQEHLLQWVKAFGNTPKRVFVVHGQDAVCDTFAELVTKETGVIATAPYSGDIYDLQANICIAKGSRERAVKKVKDARVVSNVFARLVAAGERLLAVIRKLEGHPNKELGKFADQINSLCDKWDQ